MHTQKDMPQYNTEHTIPGRGGGEVRVVGDIHRVLRVGIQSTGISVRRVVLVQFSGGGSVRLRHDRDEK